MSYNKSITDNDNDYEIVINNKTNINNTIEKIINNVNNAWDDSINDDNFIINSKIMRVFPQLNNISKYSKLKIDGDSFSYITLREVAELTTKIICYHLIKYNINPQKVNIIDYTSGVGGNVLSFCKHFNKVYAVELSKLRYEYLINNVNVYGFNNVSFINDSCINVTNILSDINSNVIFIDPPWGGPNYKECDNLRLSIDNVPIENLVIKIFNIYVDYNNKHYNNEYNVYNNKFVVLKLPKNYDVEYFYEYIKKNNILKNHIICTYLYILNKMLLLVCELSSLN